MVYAELADLYERHRASLVRAAARLLGDPAAAEDVVQETWLKALERYGCGGPDERLLVAGWFYRVALNLCYDRLRAARRAGVVPLRPGEADGTPGVARASRLEASAATVDPQEALLEAELGEAVRAAVDGLPPLLREVILLREGAGLKYREIAAAIGCPPGTVMSRLHLARQRLKRALGLYLELDWREAGQVEAQTAGGREGDGRAVVGQAR